MLMKEINDLITTTLQKLGKARFEQIAQRLQEYEVMGWLLKKSDAFGGIEEVEGGRSVKELLMTKVGGTFRWVGLFEKDTVNITDHMTELEVEWCHGTDNMAFERREILANKGEARIVNVIVPRRTAMMLRVAEALEAAFFSDPVAGETKIPWGLPYWVVKNSTKGFNGGVHPNLSAAGVTTVGGVNVSQHPTFRNWTATYSNISKDDLVTKMREAHYKTNWKSPVTAQEFRSEWGQRRKIFTTYAVLSALERLAEDQNDQLGSDIASMDGEVTFRRHPIKAIRYLDEGDSTNPVYMVDLASFKMFVLKGDYLRESEAQTAPFQHNVSVVYVDLTYQTMCVNRRANAVIYKP